MTDHAGELLAAGKAASDHHDADIYLYSGPIEEGSIGDMAEVVTDGFNGRDRCILILATNGGSANGAFRIARFFQRTYTEFLLYCPGTCKSAGTLIALGANKLIMDHFSELGPLDVQIAIEDELGARKSGLLASSTFDALAEQTFSLYSTLMTRIKVASFNQISFKLASQLAADMTAHTIGNLYSQMNPEVIGSERRSLLIAKRYGHLLSEKSNNARNSHTVDHLVSCYPSHDFVIDDEEARKWFRNVELPSKELYRLIGALGKVALEEAPETLVLPLSPRQETSDDKEGEEGEGSGDRRDGKQDSEAIASDGGGSDPSDARGATAVDDSGQTDRKSDAGKISRGGRKSQPGTISIMRSK